MIFDSLIFCDKILLYQNHDFICVSDKVIAVQDGQIAYLGNKDSTLKAKKIYQLKNHLISPGFVNTHTHLPMSLFRGLADNLSLQAWLEDYIFPLEAKMVKEDFVTVATQLSAIELIRTGVTTCCDMYFYNQAIAQALDQAGLRAYVGVGLPTVETWQDWKQQVLKLKALYKHHPRITITLAPHAPYTLEPSLLREIAEFSKKENIFITIHVSESLWEQTEIQKKYGKTPVEFLHDLGMTGEHSLFVHCVQLNQKDLQIMSQTQTSMSYNPESNMKLGNGIAPVNMALQEGVVVGLGTDGSASNNNLNFFEEMGTGAKLQALKYGDKSLTAKQMFKMATIEGARALGLAHQVGSLEVGKKADLIALDLNSLSFHPFYEPLSHIVYTCLGQEVSFVMCEGQVLMENYEIKTLKESEVLKESKIYSEQVKEFVSNKK